ncbi:MAG: hypothetical protein IJ212_06345 [Bacteroidaceae bacterium]|nr:hypothetical protein [Bacteroidaceae bacterium]
MKHDIKLKISAIFLLMIMALQVGVKSVHLHHHAESASLACQDCEQHKVHSGHISVWDHEHDDCLICQLLVVPFLKGTTLSLTTLSSTIPSHCISYISHIQEFIGCNICLRAPPSFLSLT